MSEVENVKKKERILGLDLIRAIAILFVIGVHFFIYTDFYTTNVIGYSMISQVFLRTLFICAVPLFLILMGYFSKDTKYSKSFFKKLIGLFTLYLLYGLIEYVALYDWFSVKTYFVKMFNFSLSPYVWFVEMYIGLYLLTPFINTLYNNLDTKMKKYLIIVLVCLTFLPSTINNKFIEGFALPEFWVTLYPICYFLIGKFIKEYQPKFKKFSLICTLAVILIIETIIEVEQAGGYVYSYFFGYRNSLPVMVCAILIFLILYDIKSKKATINKLFMNISIVTFDIYLVSRTVQHFVYPYFLNIDIPSYRCVLYLFPAILSILIIGFIIGMIRKKLIKI